MWLTDIAVTVVLSSSFSALEVLSSVTRFDFPRRFVSLGVPHRGVEALSILSALMCEHSHR